MNKPIKSTGINRNIFYSDILNNSIHKCIWNMFILHILSFYFYQKKWGEISLKNHPKSKYKKVMLIT